MAHFYDSTYWHSPEGQLLRQARRLLATILEITEEEPTLPAPMIVPLVDYYRSTAWQGFCATWFASNGDELSIICRGDGLEIWAEDANHDTVFWHPFSNAEAGRGNPEHRYQRYSTAGLLTAVAMARTWLQAHRAQLGTIEDSIDQMFFNAPASPQEQAWQEEWGGYKDEDRMWHLRRLFTLAQAVNTPDTDKPFFTFMGYSDDDHNLQAWHELDLEWLFPADDRYAHASIGFYKDGEFIFHAGSATGQADKFKTDLSIYYGEDDPEGVPLTRASLLTTIATYRTWLAQHFPLRVAHADLFYECGFEYDKTHTTWVNTFEGNSETVGDINAGAGADLARA